MSWHACASPGGAPAVTRLSRGTRLAGARGVYDPTRARDLRRVSEKSHEIEGILYLYGAGVKAGTRIDGPRLVDVTPTILTLAGLPAGRDMRGRVLSEALTVPEPERIATYETGKAREQKAREETAADRALLEHLGSLGYLGARSPSGDRNLAAVLFRQGRLEESADQYRKLVAEQPDDAPLRASFAGVLARIIHEVGLGSMGGVTRRRASGVRL